MNPIEEFGPLTDAEFRAFLAAFEEVVAEINARLRDESEAAA